MGRAHEKWHICKCLVFHAENLLKVYTQKNSGYTKSRRKIRQQKIPKIDSKFLHIELLSREAWTSKDTRFLTLSRKLHTRFHSVSDVCYRCCLTNSSTCRIKSFSSWVSCKYRCMVSQSPSSSCFFGMATRSGMRWSVVPQI